MLIRNATKLQIELAADCAAVRIRDIHDAVGRRGYRVTLAPNGDRYRKYSPSFFRPNRRTNSVCFHGHLAFMQQLYQICPTTMIDTSLIGKVRYRSAQDLQDNAYKAAGANVGPLIAPVTYGSLCGC